jgi:hypothetical protein
MTARLSRRRMCLGLLALSCAVAGCGTSASPLPTATARPTAVPRLRANPASLAVARRFLRAFIDGKRKVMLSLMTRRLRRQNRAQFISQMLDVSGTPGSFTIVRAHTFQPKAGPWTRAVVRIELDHGAALDRLGLVRTSAGWRVNTIKAIGAVG